MRPKTISSSFGRAAAGVALALVAAGGSSAARAQSYFDPHQVPTVMTFRPGSWDDLLFLTHLDVGANVVVARHMPDGKLVTRTEIKGPFTSATFFGRDRILTGDQRGAVTIWSLDGRKLAPFVAAGAPVSHLSVSPSGRIVAMRHPKGPIRVWSAAGQLLATIGLGPTGIECEDEFGTGKIVFTPDERMFVSADNCGNLIAATIDGRRVPIDERDRLFVSGIALSGDGRTLLLSYFGMPGGGADFRTIGANRVSAPRAVPGPFGHADPEAIAAVGDRFVIASRNRLRFLTAEGKQLGGDVAIEGPQALAVSDNGGSIAVYAKEGVVMFSGSGGRAVRRPFADFGMPAGVAVLSEPGVIAALWDHGVLQFWKISGTEARSPAAAWSQTDVEHADYARPKLRLAPGRRLLAVVTPLNTVQLFDANGERRGAPLAVAAEDYHGLETNAVALLDDRVVVPASDGRSLRVLSLEGAELAANLAPHQHKIRALAFSSDGSRFATQDGRGVLRLWSSDGTQIKEQRTLRGLEHGGLVFAPGAGIVAVRGGSKIMLWHTDGPGRIEQRPGQFVRFLPDGALVRVEGDMLVIDGLDGAERYAKSFREPIVYAVSDDARWAIVSERGITRYVVLD